MKRSLLALAVVAGCGSSSKPEATTKQTVLPANTAPVALKRACPEIPPEQETISFCSEDLRRDVVELVCHSVTNICPVAGLKSLERLDLNITLVEDLSPLVGLTNLKTLLLNHTRAQNLSPLAGLTNLEMLGLYDTWVQDVAPLTSLTNLEVLWWLVCLWPAIPPPLAFLIRHRRRRPTTPRPRS